MINRKSLALACLIAAVLLVGCGTKPTVTAQAPAPAPATPAPSTPPSTTPVTPPPTPATPVTPPVTPPAPATPPTTPATPVTPPVTPPAPATPPKTGTVELTVKMMDYSFEPKDITIAAGSKVKLTIVNNGEKRHDFNIVGLLEGDILEPGASQVIEFTVDKPGEMQIVCSQRGHKDKGMVATLFIK